MTVTRVEALTSPAALRTCAAGPAVPDPGAATGYTVGIYIRHLAAAHEDCAATLAARNVWEDEAAARLEQSSDP